MARSTSSSDVPSSGMYRRGSTRPLASCLPPPPPRGRAAGLERGQAAAGGFSHSEWQVARRQDGFVFQNHGALDRVLQFAHIARPVVSQQQAAGFRADAANGFLELAVVPVNEEIQLAAEYLPCVPAAVG